MKLKPTRLYIRFKRKRIGESKRKNWRGKKNDAEKKFLRVKPRRIMDFNFSKLLVILSNRVPNRSLQPSDKVNKN